MGVRRLLAQAGLKTVVLMLFCSLPAYACAPVMTGEYALVALGTVVWVVASVAYLRQHPFVREEIVGGVIYTGTCWFLLEMAPLWIFIPALMVLPAYLTACFFLALFSKGQPPAERSFRLVYYGWPALAILFLGILGRIGLTGTGVHLFLWNLLKDEGNQLVFAAAFFTGLLVLIVTSVTDRMRASSRNKKNASEGGSECHP